MKYLYLTILIFLSSSLHSQDLLKEIFKTYENGQPMYIDYVETENLQKVKKEIYNENGEIIFSIQFDPISGLPHGKFYDKINKGFFHYGMLNCYDCLLVGSNKPSVFSHNYNKQNTNIEKGNIVMGKYLGEIERFTYFEKTYDKIDWESSRKYVAAGAGIAFRDIKTVKTGVYQKTVSKFLTYNSEAELEQDISHKYLTTSVINGMLDSYIRYDINLLTVDSLSNKSRLWKQNYKWKKNDGFLLPIQNLTSHINGEGFRFTKVDTGYNAIILTGGYTSVTNNDRRASSFFTGGSPQILDHNGLFTIHDTDPGIVHDILFYQPFIGSGLKKRSAFAGSRYRLDFEIAKSNSKWEYHPNKFVNSNLFYIIYNYLINNDKMFHKGIFGFEESPETLGSMEYFNRLLLDPSIKNTFSKYLKYKPFKNIDPDKLKAYYENYPNGSPGDWEIQSAILNTPKDFKNYFSTVISLSDYLKAIKDAIISEEIQLKEIRVWNILSKKYDLVNFEKLIFEADKINQLKEIPGAYYTDKINNKKIDDNVISTNSIFSTSNIFKIEQKNDFQILVTVVDVYLESEKEEKKKKRKKTSKVKKQEPKERFIFNTTLNRESYSYGYEDPDWLIKIFSDPFSQNLNMKILNGNHLTEFTLIKKKL